MRDWLPSELKEASISLDIIKAEAFVMRASCAVPVRTSFGTMHDRPAVFVRLEDKDGTVGLGEVWCNFPSCGAEHRARLLETAIFPALFETPFEGPAEAFSILTKRFERLAIQAGEQGPIAQCLAGIDLALWDLVARRANVPLFKMLGGSSPVISTYASGINPTGTAETVARCRAAGYKAFKLKIGFGDDVDLSNLQAVADSLRPDEQMMCDANQGWSVDKTLSMLPKLQAFPLQWLEEPLLATSPAADWAQLARHSKIPLAAGENIMGSDDFANASAGGSLAVIQPDICKWGGISGTYPVAKDILKNGRRYCPHYLGAGIGLTGSAHLLAAIGGDGLLEIDSNINPLREELFNTPLMENGCVDIGDLPGLGIAPEMFENFLASHVRETTLIITAAQ
ncbi:MAG: mandelate racemase/muconate lactonizing enzyme family protein [Sulfitobacter sp.]